MLKTVGDWNSKGENKAESNITGKLGLGVRNEAEDWLMDFCEANNLSIASTCIEQLNRLL